MRSKLAAVSVKNVGIDLEYIEKISRPKEEQKILICPY